MALFDISRPANDRANDKKIAEKSGNAVLRKAVPTIKSGGSLMGNIASAEAFVKKHLGKYAEEYMLIQDETVLKDYCESCIRNGVISIDTETTGLDPLLDEIAGVCIYTPGEKSAYIPINHVNYISNSRVKNQLSAECVRDCLSYVLEAKADVIMFNSTFDIRVLRNRIGLHNIYCTWDCYLAHRILNENEENNKLKPLYSKYVLNGEEDSFTFEEFFKGIPFTMIPLKTAYLYAAHDPKITYELYAYQHRFLREDAAREDYRQMYWLLKNIEMPCVSVVADMEDNGVCLDLSYATVLSEKYNKLLTEKSNAVYEQIKPLKSRINEYRRKHRNCKLDEPINIASTDQLAILFYDILGYDVIDKKKPRGTGEDILQKMNSPIANAVLEFRGIQKLLNTYIDKLPNCLNPNDGRVHGKFNQYGAKTGRFSSSDPNLQNIPSHNKDIRPMFTASNNMIEVTESDNSFTVDRWTEVNTADGWVYADSISVGDKLIVDEDGTQIEITVTKIKTLIDSNQIVYYISEMA